MTNNTLMWWYVIYHHLVAEFQLFQKMFKASLMKCCNCRFTIYNDYRTTIIKMLQQVFFFQVICLTLQLQHFVLPYLPNSRFSSYVVMSLLFPPTSPVFSFFPIFRGTCDVMSWPVSLRRSWVSKWAWFRMWPWSRSTFWPAISHLPAISVCLHH